MARAKKSGRITLRVTPERHQQVADVARDLGVDVNGLFNLMLARWLGEMAAEARVFRAYREKAMSQSFIRLFAAWVQARPAESKPQDFFAEFRKHILGEPSWFDGRDGQAESPAGKGQVSDGGSDEGD